MSPLDATRETLCREKVGLWKRAVSQAEEAVADAFERDDRAGLMHWTMVLTLRRERLEQLEDEQRHPHTETKLGQYFLNDNTRLLCPSELADYLHVERAWVYEHASELGVIRLGSGPRARLRFDLDRVLTCLAGRESVPAPAPVHKPKRRRAGHGPSGRNVDLLPVRPRKPRPEAAGKPVEGLRAAR